MDWCMHDMSSLFAQLGLPSDDGAIQAFVDGHRPLADSIPLYEAPFWTVSQAAFLREEIIEDADWAVVIDQLNNELRATGASDGG